LKVALKHHNHNTNTFNLILHVSAIPAETLL
jgi:hypothetical protein